MDTETEILEEPGPNRALPPTMLNILRTGVPGNKPDDRKVWGKFVRLAMSCRRRGWTENQFYDEMWSQETRIYAGGKKVFGNWPLTIQLMTAVKGNTSRAHRQIVRAWMFAGDNLLREGTLKSTEDFFAEAINTAHAWQYRLDDDTDQLSRTQKLIMIYVIESVLKRGFARVTCPSREVGAACGVPPRTAHWNLKALTAKGFLVLHDKGVHSADPKHWKAALYSLSDPDQPAYLGSTALAHKTPSGSTPMCNCPMGKHEEAKHHSPLRAADDQNAEQPEKVEVA